MDEFQSGDINEICHKAFSNIVKITKYTREKIAKAFKSGKSLKSVDVSTFEDQQTTVNKRKLTKVTEEVFTLVTATLERNNTTLTRDELIAFQLPNSEAAIKLNAWFQNYFDPISNG